MIDKKLLYHFKELNYPKPDDLFLTCLIIEYQLDCVLNSQHLIYLSRQGLIKRDSNGEIELIKESIPESIIVNKEFNIQDYRLLFKGIRQTSMGSKQAVIQLMNEFLLSHQEYSYEDCITATKMFIEQQVDKTFIPNADNFIMTYRNEKPYSTLELALENMNIQTLDSTWL